MKKKELKFMQDLHKIRAKLSKEWVKMTDKEFVAHMHKLGREFKKSSPARSSR